MLSLKLLFIIFLFEMFVLGLGGILIGLLNLYLKTRQSKINKQKTILYDKLLDYFFMITDLNIADLHLLKQEKRIPVLVPIIEEISEKLDDDKWNILKGLLVKKYLKDFARKNINHPFWSQRNWSARIFALSCHFEDEQYILHLISDRMLLVRIYALNAARKLGSQACYERILFWYSKGKGFSNYIFKDAFIQSGQSAIQFVKQVLLSDLIRYQICSGFSEKRLLRRTKIKTNDNDLKKACLEILCMRTYDLKGMDFSNELVSEDADIRYLAYQLSFLHPTELLQTKLMNVFSDEDWRIRAFGCKRMGELQRMEALPYLMQLLQDKVYDVRLNAALSLKNMGEPGMEILKNTDPDIDRFAYEMSRYVLSLSL